MSTFTTDGSRTRRRQKPQARPGTAVQLLARRLHFVAGIVVAPFLAVLCLTGLIYDFSPEIHDSLYHEDLYVAAHHGAPHPLAEQIHVALTAHPEATVEQVIPPPDPQRTTRVVLSVPGQSDVQRTVYVDPYSDYINGDLITVDNRLPANTWLRKFHSNLHLGEPGRWYAELGATWLPLLALGGVLIWLMQPRRRMRVRELFVPSLSGKTGWARVRALHGTLGLWLTVGLLVTAVTGLAMSQFAGGRANESVDPIHLRAPTLVAAAVSVPPNVAPVGIDRVVAVAHGQGLTGELIVTPPATPSKPYTVVEMGEGLPIHRDAVAIDPYTAHVTERIGWGDYSLPAKLTALATQFHTGTLFGLANQIVIALIAAATFVLVALGYRMWWIHNPYRRRWAALPQPVWRQLPPWALGVALLGIAVLARVLPVFGASLAVFVVIDSLVTVLVRRSRRASH
ncbi:PepSY domain-containing protein [Amycolatopsis sp. K13G38]|uniref:PepSY domain-containing protein n=1 Tax=Amycolatopsis acididurans TaxID=2724524 RepID=A0ABX1JDM7_9PSEU|nr:PepSY domain-containing protein [Amycolatopsis acididurans]NKQ57897.1 PepSY domain-containing protein [Amycolatopsis acididurans]